MTKAKEMPPVELLRELFYYNPETGELRWKKARNQVSANSIAGAAHGNGYRMVIIGRNRYYVHRILYTLYHNDVLDPYDQIDHINRVRDDNRLINLRKVTFSENNFNTKCRRDNTTGHKGVSYDKRRQKWYVKFQRKYVGRYNTLEEAVAARKQAETDYGVIC